MTNLATLRDVAVELGTTPDETNLRMAHALEQASYLVRSYTGQQFDFKADDVIRMSGTGTDTIQLPQLAIYGDVVVALKDYLDSEVTLPAHFTTRLDAKTGLLYRMDDTWPLGRLNIEVTYSHGYLLPGLAQSEDPLDPILEPLPPLVQRRTASIAAALYAVDPSGTITNEAIGNYSVGFSTGSASAEGIEQDLYALYCFRVVDAA